MKKVSKEQLRKRFQVLSDDLQDLIFSERTADTIRKAAILGNLEGKTSFLGEMTGLVLMGYLNPLDFEKELSAEFSISDQQAKQIANILKTEIFDLVETDLKKLYPPSIKTPTVVSGGFKPKTKFIPKDKKDDISMKGEIKNNFSEIPKREEAKTEKSGLSEFEKRFLAHRNSVKKVVESDTGKKNDFETSSVLKNKTINLKRDASMPLAKEDVPVDLPTKPIKQKEFVQKDVGKEMEIPKDDVWGDAVKMGQIMQSDSNKNEDVVKKEEKKTKDNFKDMSPVVPIPTIIKSQFQPLVKKENEKRTEQDSELKELGKNLEAKDKLNKTKVNEDKIAKVDGNVIDLRDL